MEKSREWLNDSCRQMLMAVSERDSARLDAVLAGQRERAAIPERCLDSDAQKLLLASLAQAELLANLQRAHLLEAVKNCQHQLAVLQSYQQNCT
jgi:hypothetical protein